MEKAVIWIIVLLLQVTACLGEEPGKDCKLVMAYS